MRREATRETVICVVLAAVLIVLNGTVRTPESRMLILRGVLILFCGFEFIVGGLQAFTTARFMDSRGWSERKPYFGFVQDLGLYQLSFGLAFLIAAIDPARYVAIIYIGSFLYFLHGFVHVSRYLGALRGRSTYFDPKEFELRLGQGFFLVPLGLLLFRPWPVS